MLEPIVKVRNRVRIGVYDLEWDPEDNLRLRLIGVRDASGYRAYTTVKEFLRKEFTYKTHGTVFYAHAGGLADIQFLFRYFWAEGYECSGVTSGSSVILLTIRRGRYKWTLADSYWTLRDSLREVGKSIGLEKGHCAFDAPISILRDYNERDCEILYVALNRLQDELWGLGGELCVTLASCAMRLFRRVYLQEPINNPHHISDRLRPGYSGGRVEVHERYGRDTLYDYDINSSFPFAMLQDLPGDYIGASRKIRPYSWVDVTVRTTGGIPALPYRQEALYFPTGTFRGWFYCEELDQPGVEILQVHEVLHFRPQGFMNPYIQEIYSRRKATSDKFQKMVYKLLMNSLYGKTGERGEKTKIVVNPPRAWLERAKAEAWAGRTMVQPGLYVEEFTAHVEHEHVALCGAITAIARKNLRAYMLDSRVYYCDTDGFCTDRDGLPTSEDLGGLKKKTVASFHESEPTAIFLGPKMYRLGTDIRAKGFPLRMIVEELRRNGDNLGSLDLELDLFGDDKDRAESKSARVELFRRIEQTGYGGSGLSFRQMRRVGEQLARKEIPHEEERIKTRRVLGTARPKRFTFADGTTRPWDVDELTGEA